MARRTFLNLAQFAKLLQRPVAAAIPEHRFLSQSSQTQTSSRSYQALLTRVGLGVVSATAAAAAAAPVAFASPSPAVLDPPATKKDDKSDVGAQAPGSTSKTQYQVVFVLGGPGSGKGTQCARLLEEYLDIAHFSAGDLLRAFVKSGTPEGEEVAEMIRQGQIVPAEVTVGLLDRAIAASGKRRILIDGFPRNLENRQAWERVMGYDCTMVLFFDCPEEEMERRLLARNQGRVDDNIETIKKRFKVFVEQTTPVVEHYEALGKVVRVRADRPPEVVFDEVKKLFA